MTTNQNPNEKALANYVNMKSIITRDEVIERFTRALGERRGQAFVEQVLTVVYDNPSLMECDPNSVIVSCLRAASLDLPVDPQLGYAWIIPYWNSTTRRKEAQFQAGFRTYVQLGLRTGLYLRLNAGVVYEGQVVVENQITGEVTLEGEKTSDKVVGFIAYQKQVTGFEGWFYMTYDEVFQWGKRYAPSWGFKKDRNGKYTKEKLDLPQSSSPWATSFVSMGKKTVLKNMLKNYGVTTTGLTQAQVDAVEKLEIAFDADESDDIDNERVVESWGNDSQVEDAEFTDKEQYEASEDQVTDPPEPEENTPAPEVAQEVDPDTGEIIPSYVGKGNDDLSKNELLEKLRKLEKTVSEIESAKKANTETDDISSRISNQAREMKKRDAETKKARENGEFNEQQSLL